ncbi:MAG: xanthine dehydrogenase family protein molybdopterin-binding subunit, partial [Stellaceae bacterium]
EWLGVPFESVRLVQGDTDAVAFGRGTYASRSTMLGGSALKGAADAIIEKAKQMAGHLLETAVADIEFKEGKFTVKGTDKAIPMTDVAKAFYRPVGPTTKFGTGLDASGSSAVPPSFPNGCHVCELEIDPETGVVEVVKYTMVDDFGVIVNPLLVEGQVHGGVTQGIGQALMEAARYDRDGQFLTGSYMDYAMPRAADLPNFHFASHPVPARSNILGVKGCGEAGCSGSLPAVMNAVVDALRVYDINHIDMPATPYRVWQAIRAAQG